MLLATRTLLAAACAVALPLVAHAQRAELALQCLALVVGEIGDDHFGPSIVQPADGRLAQAACATDNNRGATGDLHMVPLLATDTLNQRE